MGPRLKAAVVIFGATGNLSKLKLFPSLYHLCYHHKELDLRIIATSRKKISPEKLVRRSKKYFKPLNEAVLLRLASRVKIVRLDFNQLEDFSALREELSAAESSGYKNFVFYLATSPDFFCAISNNLGRVGLSREVSGWRRIVFEKPFGFNLKSSLEIDRSVREFFKESQVYRIDHYLGKELVEGVLVLRFSNLIFEPLWNRDYIESVCVILDEEVGISNRGHFYDKYGAIRDMVQSHILQLISLISMEKPKSLYCEDVRDKKVEVLKRISVKDTLVGQYKSYRREKGVSRNSRTETFAAHVFDVGGSRWRGVKFFARTGKKLKRKDSRIIINFKKSDCLFESKKCPVSPNSITIQLYPDDGIFLRVNSKVPEEMDSRPVNLRFFNSLCFGPNTPESYSNLFRSIFLGNHLGFIRRDGLFEMWKIVEKIKKGKLYIYEDGSRGPPLDSFCKRNGIRWG